MSWFKRMYYKFKSRNWREEDHDDCISFHGPCNLCRDHLRSLGYDDN